MTKTQTTKTMWAFLNYGTLWGVAYTRQAAKHDIADNIVRNGRYSEKALAEVDRRLKDGSFTIRKCLVKMLPIKKRKHPRFRKSKYAA